MTQMDDTVNLFFDTGNADELRLLLGQADLQALMELYNRICNTLIKQSVIQTLSQLFRETLAPEVLKRIMKRNAEVCNLAEAYKARYFALVFDPTIQNVYERLIDRTVTVRNEAALLSVRMKYVKDQKVAQRLISVLQNSDDRLLQAVVDQLPTEELAVSEYLSSFLRQQTGKISNPRILMELGVSPWDTYLRQPTAFPLTFFECILSGEFPMERLLDLQTQAVLHEYETICNLPDSITFNNNVWVLEYVENLLKQTPVNPNELKASLRQELDNITDAAVTESYGYIWARCWLNCDVNFITSVYKDCRAYQETENRTENTAILHKILAYVIERLSIPEWANIAGEIILSYLSHVDDIAAHKESLFIGFLAKSMTHSQIAEKNIDSLNTYVTEVYSNLSDAYCLLENDNQQFQEQVVFVINIMHIGAAFVSNISNFCDIIPDMIHALMKIRNTLGKLASRLAMSMFNFQLQDCKSREEDLYVAILQSVNVSLITPGVKDYNFETINKWVEQLIEELDIYSTNTFLKSMVYKKDENIASCDIQIRSSIVFLTIANCIDLVTLELLFTTESNVEEFIKQFSRLVYHLTASSTLKEALSHIELILDEFQPVYAKLMNFCSFVDVSVEIGCILGIILRGIPSSDKLVEYLITKILDEQTPMKHVAGILAGICCALGVFRFGEESVDEIRCVIIAMAKISVIPVIFLCVGRDKALDHQIMRIIEQNKAKIPQQEEDAINAQLHRAGYTDSAAPSEEAEACRLDIVRTLSVICKLPAAFLDSVYE